MGAIAEMFNIKLGTVANHLWESVRDGVQIDAEPLLVDSKLTPDEQTRVLRVFEELGVERLRPVFDAFQEAVPYEELHLLRLYVAAKE